MGYRVPGGSSRMDVWRDVFRRVDGSGQPLLRPPLSTHLQRGSPTFAWLMVGGLAVVGATAPFALGFRILCAPVALWVIERVAVGARAQWVVVDERGVEFRERRVHRAIDWSNVAAVDMHRPFEPSGSAVRLSLQLRPGSAPPRVALPQVARDVVLGLRAHLDHSGFEIPINPTPPWRDRWGTWHGPMFERDPREAIRSVHEAYVGPWRIRVRRVDAHYQALIEMTIGNARVREGEVRTTLREAADDGSQFVLDAQATVAAGGDLAAD